MNKQRNMGNQKNSFIKIKVLMIDDEEAYLNILIKRMKIRNIDVIGAKSGSDGVKLLSKEDFDVTILDLKMADIYGLEILKMFRIISPNMPVIMLSGHGSQAAAREALRLGAFAYLNKPCELNDLIKKIQEAYYSVFSSGV